MERFPAPASDFLDPVRRPNRRHNSRRRRLLLNILQRRRRQFRMSPPKLLHIQRIPKGCRLLRRRRMRGHPRQHRRELRRKLLLPFRNRPRLRRMFLHRHRTKVRRISMRRGDPSMRRGAAACCWVQINEECRPMPEWLQRGVPRMEFKPGRQSMWVARCGQRWKRFRSVHRRAFTSL